MSSVQPEAAYSRSRNLVTLVGSATLLSSQVVAGTLTLAPDLVSTAATVFRSIPVHPRHLLQALTCSGGYCCKLFQSASSKPARHPIRRLDDKNTAQAITHSRLVLWASHSIHTTAFPAPVLPTLTLPHHASCPRYSKRLYHITPRLYQDTTIHPTELLTKKRRVNLNHIKITLRNKDKMKEEDSSGVGPVAEKRSHDSTVTPMASGAGPVAGKESHNSSVSDPKASRAKPAGKRSHMSPPSDMIRRQRREMIMKMFMGRGDFPDSDEEDLNDMAQMEFDMMSSHHSDRMSRERAVDIEERRRRALIVKPDLDNEITDKAEDMQVDCGVIEALVPLYTLTVNECDHRPQHHSILMLPHTLPQELHDMKQRQQLEKHSFNLVMIDTSGSMDLFWNELFKGWNTYVAPVLMGRTAIYTFSTDVILRREGTQLEQKDMDHGRTNLTGAFQKIADEVYTCREKFINVFLVTDGDHNVSRVDPNEVLEMLEAPRCKVVDMFVLGAGTSFPVRYSITLRSRLHNGNSNLPSLFLALNSSNMQEQMASISENISKRTRSIVLSQKGFSLPGTKAKTAFHLKEWVYFPCGPEALQNLTITTGFRSGQLKLDVLCASPDILNKVFRQWNSILIQLHNSKKKLPVNAIPFMESLFKASVDAFTEFTDTSITARLKRKSLATLQTTFQTMINKLRDVLTKNSYSNQMELAENILNTTVGGGKYESKVLTLKGHTDEDYRKDCQEFLKVLTDNHEAIDAQVVNPDDCCHILLTSTLSDLQDSAFPRLTEELNKFDFLKEFTISGVGVFIPIRDSITINPWSLSVQATLKQPFNVVSQKAMESSANIKPVQGKNKEIQLKADDESTQFNAVIPVFSPEVASVMKHIVRTRLFAMCTTFAILKNPHIIDFNVHFAALGVLWVRFLHEYPTLPRPDHVKRKIQSIEATAKLYVNRPSYANYWMILKQKTPQGLMTESTEVVDGKTIKCESLIKPMFILHLMRQQEDIKMETMVRIIIMMLLEYTGRCLSQYKLSEKNAIPFTDFFSPELVGEEKRQQWRAMYIDNLLTNTDDNSKIHLQDFYTKEKVEKAAKKIAVLKIKKMNESKTGNIRIDLDTERIAKLRNVTAAGDVSWSTLRTYVGELELPEETVQEVFSKESLTTYVVHALKYRNSRERLQNSLPSYQDALDMANSAVCSENKSLVSGDLLQQITKNITKSWLQEYASVHNDVVQPMTKEQIVAEAQKRGIEVTLDSFDQVYRHYRPNTGLVGNACLSHACPFYLKPDRTYNQHASIERLHIESPFPHAFHKAAYLHRQDILPNALANLESGVYRPPRGPQAPLSHERVTELAPKMASLQIQYRTDLLDQEGGGRVVSVLDS
ncbi:hypothetical protein Pcinc_029210 [Petrolisthes cinctipes]|uniref:VWFA domain-containing protein n=1 Tax=Petrolisthes cinctipes TaxID=88211 RepID=A0AAE1F0T5_PETCI|nr:hypothetical protein Pcinc_029210 [Petrolisthes cinctipes]